MKDETQEFKRALTKVMKDIDFSERDRQKVIFQLREERKKKVYHKYFMGMTQKYILSAVILCLSFGIMFVFPKVSPSLANSLSSIPFIESIFKIFGDEGLKTGTEKQLSTNVVKTSSGNGTVMNIDEAIYDGERISISYVVESEEPITDFQIKKLDFNNGQEGKDWGYLTDGNYEVVTPNKVAGIATISFYHKTDLPNNLEVNHTYWALINGKSQKFNFTFDLSKTQNEKSIVPMITKNNGQNQFTAKEMKLTPITTVVNLSFKRPQIQNKNNMIRFRLITENGEVIPWIYKTFGYGGIKYEGNLEVMDSIQESFESIYDRKISSVTLQPIVVDANTTIQKVQEPLKNEPTKLILGELGEINILDVNHKGSTMSIKYELNSVFPFLNPNYFVIKDEDGKFYNGIRKSKRFIKKDHYIIEEEYFNLPNRDLTIQYEKAKAPEILTDLEIDIPVQ